MPRTTPKPLMVILDEKTPELSIFDGMFYDEIATNYDEICAEILNLVKLTLGKCNAENDAETTDG